MIKRLWCILLVCLPIACQTGQTGEINTQLTEREWANRSSIYPYGSAGSNYMYNYYLPPAGTSTPWWPTWSPDGKWIAFSMQGTIWKMRVGDTAAYELVHSDEYLSSPEWSPDGRYIAFTADKRDKTINLQLLDLETETVTELTFDKFVNLDPAWSPDGGKLAYVSTCPNKNFNIFVMSIEDGKPGDIIQVTEDHKFGKSRLYFGNNDLHIQPAWAPDGESLLCISNCDIPLGSGAIWKMPAVKNGFKKAKIVHAEETLYRTRPHVSPDGKRFIYSSHLGGQFNNLFVLPTEGGEPYKMTFGAWDSFHPRWSPDGEQIAYISNQEGLPHLHLLKTFGGTDKKVEIKSLVWKQPMGKVQVKIVDDNSNERLPARIYATTSDTKTYVPPDAYHRVSNLNEHFFHTSGDFILEVPEGELVLEAMHGFKYYPVEVKIDVAANKNNTVEIRLPRMSNLALEGWYSVDTHTHMNYAGNLHNTPENILLMAKAEDLNIINVLVANKDNRILDYQFFTGEPHPLSGDKNIIFFGEEYRPPFYGHISLINLKDHLISPFTTGYQGTAIESLYPSNTDIFRLAKAQGALGGYVHPFTGKKDPLLGNLGGAKGFPVDLALGVLDYHEVISWVSWAGYNVWHHALNNGFRIPAVGGEDAISNLHNNRIVGQTRTYAYMPDGLSWDGWINVIKKANMFVTNGPLLKLDIEGKMPGEEIKLPESGGKVTVKGMVQSIVPLDHVELVINGQKTSLDDLRQFDEPNRPGLHFEFEKEIEIITSSWITLQAYSRRSVHPIDDSFAQATTNPIWVMVGDQPVRSAESADYFIRWIDKLTQMAEAHPGWRSDKEKSHVLGQFLQAKVVYEGLHQQAQELEKVSLPKK